MSDYSPGRYTVPFGRDRARVEPPSPITRCLTGSRRAATLSLLLLLLIALGAAAPADAKGWTLAAASGRQQTSPDRLARISVSRVGIEGNRDSFAPTISRDGRYVAFLSSADNLVEGDTNEEQDVFLYDRAADLITRINLGPGGQEANGSSQHLAFSQEGNVIAFQSVADNLVPGDTNGVDDIFVYDPAAETLARVSVSAMGEQGNERSVQPALSADGRYVAFVSLADNLVEGDGNDVSDVFVYDRQERSLERVSVNEAGEGANGTSKYPALSADGRFVAFQSKADNLVAAAPNGFYDIFVYDRLARVPELVSVGVGGVAADHESQHPSLSADARYVSFESWASNLVAGDSNGVSDVFLYDRQAQRTERVSVTQEGGQADDVSGAAVLSADGRYVAFASSADNLSAADHNEQYDVYLRDRFRGETLLVSVNADGQAGAGSSISPAISADGRYTVFDSVAPDLVRDDYNERIDVFVFDAGSLPAPRRVVHLPLIVK